MHESRTEETLTSWQRRANDLRTAAEVLRARRGMSLVEVMVVIAIILTLMSVLAFGVFQVYGDARVDTTKLTMGKVNQRIEIYMLRKKKVPSDLDEVFANEDAPVDSWGNELRLVSPGPGNMKYDLISLGADGSEGGTGNNADIKWSDEK
ncbi:MAG: general secretion pathway protein G [Myxococcota bacterium]|jgi:general secretion pathway protein G